jgi:hypothetical protein
MYFSCCIVPLRPGRLDPDKCLACNVMGDRPARLAIALLHFRVAGATRKRACGQAKEWARSALIQRRHLRFCEDFQLDKLSEAQRFAIVRKGLPQMNGSPASDPILVLGLVIAAGLLAGSAFPEDTVAIGGTATAPVVFTTRQDHQDMLDQLEITRLRPGRNADSNTSNPANYDESKAKS